MGDDEIRRLARYRDTVAEVEGMARVERDTAPTPAAKSSAVVLHRVALGLRRQLDRRLRAEHEPRRRNGTLQT